MHYDKKRNLWKTIIVVRRAPHDEIEPKKKVCYYIEIKIKRKIPIENLVVKKRRTELCLAIFRCSESFTLSMQIFELFEFTVGSRLRLRILNGIKEGKAQRIIF